jgi:amino acid transporter
VVFCGLLSAVLALFVPIGELADLTSLGALFAFCVVALAVMFRYALQFFNYMSCRVEVVCVFARGVGALHLAFCVAWWYEPPCSAGQCLCKAACWFASGYVLPLLYVA